MKRNIVKVLFAGCAIVALGAGSAQAQLAPRGDQTMEVRVKIVDGCTVDLIGGTQVNFADRTQVIDDSLTREVNVNCTIPSGGPGGGVTSYQLQLSNTFTPYTGPAGPIYALDDRFMTNQSASSLPIYYSVRTIDTCSGPLWGDGTNNTAVINGSFPTAAGGNLHRFNICMDRAYNISKTSAAFVDAPTLGQYADTTRIQLYY